MGNDRADYSPEHYRLCDSESDGGKGSRGRRIRMAFFEESGFPDCGSGSYDGSMFCRLYEDRAESEGDHGGDRYTAHRSDCVQPSGKRSKDLSLSSGDRLYHNRVCVPSHCTGLCGHTVRIQRTGIPRDWKSRSLDDPVRIYRISDSEHYDNGRTYALIYDHTGHSCISRLVPCIAPKNSGRHCGGPALCSGSRYCILLVYGGGLSA